VLAILVYGRAPHSFAHFANAWVLRTASVIKTCPSEPTDLHFPVSEYTLVHAFTISLTTFRAIREN
jgi:hypothetical protein